MPKVSRNAWIAKALCDNCNVRENNHIPDPGSYKRYRRAIFNDIRRDERLKRLKIIPDTDEMTESPPISPVETQQSPSSVTDDINKIIAGYQRVHFVHILPDTGIK